MKNQAISVSPPAVNIQLLPNDNSYVIRGTGPEGYVNKAILKDDPDCEQKVRDLIATMYEYQQEELAGFASEAPGQIEAQYSDLSAALDSEFQPETP